MTTPVMDDAMRGAIRSLEELAAARLSTDLNGACDAYRAILEIAPASPEVQFALGLRLLQLGRTTDAERHLLAASNACDSFAQRCTDSLRRQIAFARTERPDFMRARWYGIEQLSRKLPFIASEFETDAIGDVVSTRASGVVVTGMHRSGTSLLASIIQSLGVDLGPTQQFLTAMPDNPRGYFESRQVVEINNAVLDAFNCGWDSPYALPRDWLDDPSIAHLISRAALVTAALATGVRRDDQPPLWGWKDPRACLLLPMWKRTTPDMKAMVIYRHPTEVAASLIARGGYLTRAFATRLWVEYHEQLLENLGTTPTLFVSHARLFESPSSEIARVCTFLNIQPAHGTTEDAVSRIVYTLRHHKQPDRYSKSGSMSQAQAIYEYLEEKTY